MELYQLQAFVMVAEEGSVTRAAERLFASQPAISAQIKALEQEFGFELFKRTSGGMVLTDAGLKLMSHAKTVLQQSQGLENMARHLRDGTAGTLRVGINTGVEASHIQLHELTILLLDRYPDLLLHIENGSSGAIFKSIKSQDLDIGFLEGTFDDPRLFSRQLGQTQVCIIAPTQWQDQLPANDWQALQKYPWVFPSPDCSYHRMLECLCDKHQLHLQKQFCVDLEGNALNFVRTGMAISLIDRPRAEPAIAAGDVFAWTGFSDQLPLKLSMLKSRLDEKPIQAFTEACQQIFALSEQTNLDRSVSGTDRRSRLIDGAARVGN